jgi:predicted RNA-binding Zn-ribbon protein involved in translation (DUF1610 family)
MPTGDRCAICQCEIEPGEPEVACPSCGARYHEDCYRENRGCGIYGCPEGPETEKRGDLEIPPAHWGLEHKPCPRCGERILAAALRCRKCGAVFESAAPEDSRRFRERVAAKDRHPALRKRLVWIFVLCLIPFTAPVGAGVGYFWTGAHREDLESMPGIYQALGRVGVWIGAGQTALILILTMAYGVLRA